VRALAGGYYQQAPAVLTDIAGIRYQRFKTKQRTITCYDVLCSGSVSHLCSEKGTPLARERIISFKWVLIAGREESAHQETDSPKLYTYFGL
jgi:hypothetical protein